MVHIATARLGKVHNNVFVCAGDGPGSEQSVFLSSCMDRLHKLHYCGWSGITAAPYQ